MILRSKKLRARRRGFTMTEVTLAVALASVAALLITSQFTGLGEFMRNFLSGMENQEDAVLFSGDLELDFLRGRKIEFTHFDSVEYGTKDDAAKLGYVIFGNGKMVIQSDLRPCETFHPSTTNDNLSKITLTCCGKRGDSVNFADSACVDEAGLSFELQAPNGSVITNTCLKHYTQFAVSQVGVHYGRNTPLYYIDLLSKVGIASTGSMSVGGSARRLEIYEALGNAEASPVTFCQKTIPKKPSNP